MEKISKFDRERALLRYLTDALSIPLTNAVDPLCKFGRETGIDVAFEYQGRGIGVQVTQYDGGEGLVEVGKGTLRKQEAMARHDQITPSMFIGNDPLTSITARILEKISKAESYKFDEVDAVWLLVSSNIPDAIGTLIPKGLVTSEGLSAAIGDVLASSKYDCVFYQQIMFPVIFHWSSESEWHQIVSA